MEITRRHATGDRLRSFARDTAGSDLIAAVGNDLKAGYQRIKMKIKPGKDLEFVAAVRKHFPKT